MIKKKEVTPQFFKQVLQGLNMHGERVIQFKKSRFGISKRFFKKYITKNYFKKLFVMG